MKSIDELIGKKVVMKVGLDHYRWPRKKTEIIPGHFAIVIFNLFSLIQGEIPDIFKDEDTGAYNIIATGNSLPL